VDVVEEIGLGTVVHVVEERSFGTVVHVVEKIGLGAIEHHVVAKIGLEMVVAGDSLLVV
jgi:hypothetical protein